jgi:cell division protein FtsI (penicillin-binding protein 3)
MGLDEGSVNVIEPDTVSLNKVPDVTGMGVKDAVYVLQERGLKVRMNGCGQIARQDIAAGTPAIKGQCITLTASTENF